MIFLQTAPRKRRRLSSLTERKLQERNAVLFGREMDRLNSRIVEPKR
jgi:hypothetical protein